MSEKIEIGSLKIINCRVIESKCPHCKKGIEVELKNPQIVVHKIGEYLADKDPKWVAFEKKIGSKKIDKVRGAFDYHAYLPLFDVYNLTKEIPRKDVEKIIELLKRKGEIFEPKEGYLARI